MHKENDFVP